MVKADHAGKLINSRSKSLVDLLLISCLTTITLLREAMAISQPQDKARSLATVKLLAARGEEA